MQTQIGVAKVQVVQGGVREWLTLAEAVKSLGRSQSTIERLVGSGQIKSKLEPRPGRKPERLYYAGDVERLKGQPDGSGTRAVVALKQPAQLAIAPESIVSLGAVMTKWREGIRLTEKLWLTIDEATELSGRSKAWLLRACQEGKLTAEKDGGWRLLRASLEAFSGGILRAKGASAR